MTQWEKNIICIGVGLLLPTPNKFKPASYNWHEITKISFLVLNRSKGTSENVFQVWYSIIHFYI